MYIGDSPSGPPPRGSSVSRTATFALVGTGGYSRNAEKWLAVQFEPHDIGDLPSLMQCFA